MTSKKTQRSDEEMTNLVVTDYELENGEHPIGRLVHISTVTHAWRGVLAGVTPSYYLLDASKPIALVDSTGAISTYFNKPEVASNGDVYNPSTTKGEVATLRVCRSSVSWLASW